MRGTPTGGSPIGVDLSAWDLWWEFNKDSFLHLKEAVHRGSVETGSLEAYLGSTRRPEGADTMKPTDNQVLTEILPALKQAIDANDQRDIASSCMIAMAKIGRNHSTFDLIDVFAPRLRRLDQEVRETAALAIGIAGIDGPTESTLLIDLTLDTPAGRAAYGGEVDIRTRSFAAYGLGLLAHEHTSVALKTKALRALAKLLADDRISQRNLKVAAIEAIGILAPGTSTAGERQVLSEAVQCLEHYYDRPLGPGELLIAAHCPTAIAKLIGRTHERSGHFRDRFTADLGEQGKQQRSHDVARSCALALGQLGLPVHDKNSPAAGCSKILFDTYVNHKDDQTRYFALLALAQIGGAENRTLLINTLRRAKGLDKPWCALAAGVHSFLARHDAEQARLPVRDDRAIGDVLFAQFKDARAPQLVSALAVALGLDRHREAGGAMRELMLADQAKEDQAGYLCIGLALMGDRDATADVQNVFKASTRRPDLLRQSAIALGCLGDKTAAESLRTRLEDANSNLATLAAVSEALGFIGDRRSIAPLKAMLFDKDLGKLSRAFAAVALGGIGDRAPMPWNAKIKANINYRASVETLTNQQSGILDIL
ncbi:MAG TPA: HEAT repeat domain-containing protein [Planctomycetota bacterium]